MSDVDAGTFGLVVAALSMLSLVLFLFILHADATQEEHCHRTLSAAGVEPATIEEACS